MFVPPFSKEKLNFQNGQEAGKIGQTLTACLTMLLFLAKQLGKHGTTLVHITYPSLVIDIHAMHANGRFGTSVAMLGS